MPDWFDWVDDLFGGTRDKVYSDKSGNRVRMVQDTDAYQENRRRRIEENKRGDYPHYTYNHDGDESWHYSDDEKTHSDFWSPSDYCDDSDDDSNDDSDGSEDDDTGWLF